MLDPHSEGIRWFLLTAGGILLARSQDHRKSPIAQNNHFVLSDHVHLAIKHFCDGSIFFQDENAHIQGVSSQNGLMKMMSITFQGICCGGCYWLKCYFPPSSSKYQIREYLFKGGCSIFPIKLWKLEEWMMRYKYKVQNSRHSGSTHLTKGLNVNFS